MKDAHEKKKKKKGSSRGMVGLDEGVRRPWLGDSGTLTDCPELGMSSIGM